MPGQQICQSTAPCEYLLTTEDYKLPGLYLLCREGWKIR